MHETGNTFEEWAACKSRIEADIRDGAVKKGDTVVLKLRMDSHIGNLIYFYPIADMLRDIGARCMLEIIADSTHEKEDLASKTEQFLFIQQLLRKGSKPTVTVNGNGEMRQTRFGRIQPLLAVTRNKKETFCYQNLLRTDIRFDLFERILGYFVTETFSDTVHPLKERQALKQYIQQNSHYYSMMFVQSNDEYFSQAETTRPKWGTLFDIKYNDSYPMVFSKLTLSNILYSIQALSGKKGIVSLTKQDKRTFVKGLLAQIKEVINDMSVLAQYIWSLLLRFQLESKNLLIQEEEEHTYYQSLFDTALTQAQALADGLYQLIENACLHSKSGTGYFYLRVHETKVSNSFTGENRFITMDEHVRTLIHLSESYAPLELSGDTRFYLEIRFADNASDMNGTEGMVEHFNADAASGVRAKDIKDLFWRKPVTVDDLIVHYGLRVLERTVKMNRGAFIVYTPSKNHPEEGYAYRSVYGSKNESFHPAHTYYHGTVYHILMPIEDEIRPEEYYRTAQGEDLFELTDPDKEYIPYLIQLSAREEYDDYEKKIENINRLFAELSDQIERIPDRETRIISIAATGFRLNHMELLAKALIKYLLHHMQERNLFALLLEGRYQIVEFTRTYTAFFDRSGLNYEEFELKDTQIALCLCREKESHVCFVLSGNDLMTVRKTVMNYLYFNSEHSAEFLPLVTYLTSFLENRESSGAARSVIPFDLYLDVDLSKRYVNEKPLLIQQDIWFIRYILKVLDTNMQFGGYGCKLEDVHVSLGSKIHVDTFYNAELLLQNYANVIRFAYLIASDVLREHISTEMTRRPSQRRSSIVLVAYGKFSLLLIQKACDLINASGKGCNAKYTLFPSYLTPEEQRNWQTHGKEFMDFIEAEHLTQGAGLSKYKFYVVVPISTTLQTVGKIQETLIRRARKENLSEVPVFGISTSLIISGGISDDAGRQMHYWKQVNTYKQIIEIDDKKKVRYYFSMPSKWYSASSEEGCALCDISQKGSKKSLIGVDKTSTLPDAIFDTLDRSKKVFELRDAAANDERLKRLYGCVKYSHIANDQNHYLYHLDYESYCRQEKTDADVKQWLCDKVRPGIDADCFNIVVSPLHSSNSRFLKNVLECAFDGCARVININFQSSYRDEIRAKLEFITEEYRRLNVNISNINIHVYYVDDCIIEGITYQRSRQFLHMLLAEAGLKTDRISLYHGIILLSNRSSFETIQNLLTRSLKDSFFYYLRLNVPSFNTKNLICPACTLSAQYHLMKKRSSTNIVAAEYYRLQHKHSVKTQYEYEAWMNSLLQEKAYFAKFKAWLFYAVGYDEQDDRYYYVNIKGEKVPVTPAADQLWQERFGCSIADALNGEARFSYDALTEDQRAAIANALQKHFLADRDYCRMICTHEVFSILESYHNTVASDTVTAEAYEKGLRQEILSLIRNRLDMIDAECGGLPLRTRLWMKAEWIISYIKIISRKQPSQYYHLRNVIYNIMIDWLDNYIEDKPADDLAFLTGLCEVSEQQNMLNSIMPDMKYRIFLTLVRRLSAMQSLYLIQKLEMILEYYSRFRQQYSGKKEYCHFYLGTESVQETYQALVEFPDEGHFDMDIAKLIKWSSMNGIDDSNCFVAERALKDILREKEIKRTGAVKLALLENTQVIYTGIKKMRIENDSLDWTDKDTVQDNVTRILNEASAYLRRDNGPRTAHYPYLNFSEYERTTDDGLTKEKFIKRVSGMLMLFHILCELEARSKPVDHPYDYTEVCNHIRDITDYKQCRIFSFRDHRVSMIISSDTHVRYLNKDPLEGRFDELFTEFCRNEDSDYSINRVAQKYYVDPIDDDSDAGSKETDITEVMVVPLLAPREVKDVSYVSNYFLVLYRDARDDSNAESRGVSTLSRLQIKEGNSDQEAEKNSAGPKSMEKSAEPFGEESEADCGYTRKNESRVGRADLSVKDIIGLRNFLFLRDRLEIVLDRDIANLISMISSYDYVKPLAEDRDPMILHISDLHISDFSDDEEKAFKELLMPHIKTIRKKGSPDLLLITGDVITGKYTAAGLQSTYEKAAKIIRHIVRYLWKTGSDPYVRSDWKKRILISVGNHDYASMNELEATNSKRVTVAGKPGALGDVMIKHSYFVQFIHRLLGTDIDEIISHDLNQVVNYRRLGLSVININSNSSVNPLRTNKVRVNGDAIEKMLRNVTLEDNIIYMIHHTPIYKIDYVDDVYYLNCDEKMTDIEAAVREAYTGHGLNVPAVPVNVLWIELLKSFRTYLESSLYGLGRVAQETLTESIIGIISSDKKGSSEDIYSDFLYFINCDYALREYDDKCRHFVYGLTEQMNASELDQHDYAKKAHDHFTWITDQFWLDKEYIILGGHTHQSAKCTKTLPKPMSGCKGIYEVGQFVGKDNGTKTVSYYVFHVGKEKILQFFGGKEPEEKDLTGTILTMIPDNTK